MKYTGNVIKYGDNVDTDVIIPARYLNTSDHAELASHCMEDIDKTFVNRVKIGDIMAAGQNFGCGSSREHAPWVLEYNDINLVIAENFARIFRQNMYNCGMLAIELSAAELEEIFSTFAGAEAAVETDIDNGKLRISGSGQTKEYSFKIGEFDLALVKAGGWVAYADSKY